jgi:hypothetical protein
MNIGYWNVKGKSLEDTIVDFARDCQLDIIVLAEWKHDLNILLKKLNLAFVDFFYEVAPSPVFATDKRIPLRFITKINSVRIRSVEDSINNYYTIKEVALENIGNILLVCVHLPSKKHSREYQQGMFSRDICMKIKEIEQKLNNSNTVVLGDFNMNPFDDGVLESDSFHGISSKTIAKRQYDRGKKNVFYNPTWNLYGDEQLPPGTYYKSGGYKNLYWHSLDQVLIRPSLVDSYVKGSLKILSNVGGYSLLTRFGFPNSNKYSDHLPIVFTLSGSGT